MSRRIVELAVAAAWMVALLAACQDERVALGGPCIRSEDCLSGVCRAFACAAPPPLTDSPAAASDADAEGPGGDGSAADAAAER